MLPLRCATLSLAVACICAGSVRLFAAPGAEFATTEEGIVGTYRRSVPNVDFESAKARDERDKPRVLQRQRELLERALRPGRQAVGSADVWRPQAGAGRRSGAAAQGRDLGPTRADVPRRDSRSRMLFHRVSGRCRTSSTRPAEWCSRSSRSTRSTGRSSASLQRFDVDFDLPDHLLPEFPPPIFLHNRPELGDVSRGEVRLDQQLLRAVQGHPDAGAARRPAAAADAVPAGGVQPDRRPQDRRAAASA